MWRFHTHRDEGDLLTLRPKLRSLVTAGAAVALSLAVAGFSLSSLRHGARVPSTTERPHVGRLAPDFALEDTEGQQHSLVAMRGRHVMIGFFCGCSSVTVHVGRNAKG
jgi:hypothetical protein